MSPQSIKCCVTFISSLLGAGLPDGWLWFYTSISLEEVHGEMDKIRAGSGVPLRRGRGLTVVAVKGRHGCQRPPKQECRRADIEIGGWLAGGLNDLLGSNLPHEHQIG